MTKRKTKENRKENKKIEMTAAKNGSCRIKEYDKEKNGSKGATAMNRMKEKEKKRTICLVPNTII